MIFTILVSEDGTEIQEAWQDGNAFLGSLVFASSTGAAVRLPEDAVQAMGLHSQLSDINSQLVEVAVGHAAVAGYSEGRKKRKRGKRDRSDGTSETQG